jgi:hypothetical protein
MLRVVNDITIYQRPNTGFPNRSKVIRLDNLNSYEWASSCRDMTDNGYVRIAKNLIYKDETNTFNVLNGSKLNVGGFTSSTTPLIMRGDKVVLNAGYKYLQPSSVRTVDDTAKIIEGYISKVYATDTIEFEIQDNMWLLKQTPLDTKTFTESDTLESVMEWMIDKVNEVHSTSLSVNTLTSTTFTNPLTAGNETAAQLLDRLRRLYGFNSYFRGDELRCGVLAYYASDAFSHVFIMNGANGNIPSEGQELEYQRKDDIVLSAIAHNTIKAANGTCKDGSTTKYKDTRLEVLVTIRNGNKTTRVIERGERVSDNTEGERRTFFFQDATTTAQLAAKAFEKLEQYYYDGMKGSFDTFGIPYVRHGDHVQLSNPDKPECDGIYKVKKVTYTGGESGLRQTIEIDFRIT